MGHSLGSQHPERPRGSGRQCVHDHEPYRGVEAANGLQQRAGLVRAGDRLTERAVEVGMGLGEGRHDDPPAGVEGPNVALGGWQDCPAAPEHDAARALAADAGILDDDAAFARAGRHATHCATRLAQNEQTRERGTSMDAR